MAQKTIEKLGPFTDKSVLKHTGRDWRKWIEILNKEGAAHLDHKGIKALLKKKYKLKPWWQQGVATGYEVHIGRRIEGQNLKGEYTVTVTKTFPVEQKKLWKELISPDGQAIWLSPLSPFEIKPKNTFEIRGGIFGGVRTMKAPERLRMSWQDTEWPKPTILNVHVLPRPDKKCLLVFSHDSIKDPRTKEKLRLHWKTAATQLLAHIMGEL